MPVPSLEHPPRLLPGHTIGWGDDGFGQVSGTPGGRGYAIAVGAASLALSADGHSKPART